MTLLLALCILLSYPACVALLNRSPRHRAWAFTAIGALPLLTNLPVTGFLYGWPLWSGTVRGVGVSFIDAIALALIVTRRRVGGKLPFWGLFALYAVPLFLSALFASVWLATVFACWQFVRMLLLFAAVGGEAHRPELRKALFGGFALGLIYQAGFVVVQKLGGVVQAAGTMGHQNILGLTIELAALPLVGALLAGDRRRLVGAGIGAALLCVAGTGSRGTVGIVGGAMVGLALISLARRSTAHKVKMVSMGAVALAIAAPFAIATLNERFQGASFVTQESERNSFEEAARSMAADHPFGVGANQFVLVSNVGGYAARFGVTWQFADRSVPVHNAYLLARAETGWAGELAFILLLAVPLFAALRLAFANRRSRGGDVLLGSAIALAANMVHNNFEFAVHTFNVQALLIINLALIAAEVRDQRAVRRRRPAAPRIEPRLEVAYARGRDFG